VAGESLDADIAAFRKWKRRRELLRIAQQLKVFPQAIHGRITAWRLQKRRVEWFHPIRGGAPVSAKVVVFLIHQPAGLAESVVHTCRHLVAEGYSPLVISNGPLVAGDRERLLRFSWVFIERPNFGYDFGGYQEGMRYLFDQGVEVERLVILNDSIWYPLFPGDSTLKDLEQKGYDATGALLLESTDKDSAQAKRRPFLGSFMISFNKKVVASRAFHSFWADYRPTDNKYQTIRRGERMLSYALIDSGYSICALLNHQAIASTVSMMKLERTTELLNGMVAIDPIKRNHLASLLQNQSTSNEWREQAVMLTNQITAAGNIASSAPILCLKELNTNWLKKSRDWHNLEALRKIRKSIANGQLPAPEECILREIDATLERSAISIYG